MLTSAFYNSNRGQGTPAVRPEDFQSFKRIVEQVSGDLLSPTLCETFRYLSKKGLLPAWSLMVAPVEELRKGYKDGVSLPSVKAWIGDGVLVFLPKVSDNTVATPLILLDEDVKEYVLLIDIETKHPAKRVQLPQLDGAAYILDSTLELARLELS